LGGPERGSGAWTGRTKTKKVSAGGEGETRRKEVAAARNHFEKTTQRTMKKDIRGGKGAAGLHRIRALEGEDVGKTKKPFKKKNLA